MPDASQHHTGPNKLSEKPGGNRQRSSQTKPQHTSSMVPCARHHSLALHQPVPLNSHNSVKRVTPKAHQQCTAVKHRVHAPLYITDNVRDAFGNPTGHSNQGALQAQLTTSHSRHYPASVSQHTALPGADSSAY